MLRNMKKVPLSVIFILLIGCATIPQKVRLNPQVNIKTRTIRMGANLYLAVSDTRLDGNLGSRRGDSVCITSQEDIGTCIYAKISEAMHGYGFSITSEQSTADCGLVFELQRFNYRVVSGVFMSDIRTVAECKVIVNNKDVTFTRTYKLENSKKAAFRSSIKKNEKLINEMLSELLVRVIEDEQLLEYLK